MILQQLINGLMLGATYSLVAIGYTLIFGVLRVLHFAHGEVLMAGSFMGIFIILWTGLPLYITLPLTMVATGVLGLIVEFLAIRPLRKDFHLAPLLSTIGVTIIIQNLAVKLFGGYGTRFPEAITTVNLEVGPYVISAAKILILGISLSLMVVLYFLITKTKMGRAMRAVAESHLTASFLGVNVDRIVLVTFGIASALAGAAGVMVGISFHAVCTSDDAGSEPAKAGDGIPEAIDSGRDRGVACSAAYGADIAGAEAGAILDGRFRSR